VSSAPQSEQLTAGLMRCRFFTADLASYVAPGVRGESPFALDEHELNG
jgi:hypothetical protein